MSDAATSELRPARRFVVVLATWALLWLATPGLLARDGSALLAAIALVPWALAASRPGKRAFLVEFLAAFLGFTAICSWTTYVWVGTLLCVGVAPAVWMAGAGVLLRRSAARVPLALAVPLAWTAGDIVRFEIPPPFSFGWMRLGVHLHHVEALAGAARVCGIEGLSFVLAAAAGALAAILRDGRRVQVTELVSGALPAGVALALAASTAPPPTVDGPHVLLVQPAFAQERKRYGDPRELYRSSLELTAAGVRELGERAPDLVAWGETIYPLPLVEDGLIAKVRAGTAVPPPWWRSAADGASAWDAEHLEQLVRLERERIGAVLFGEEGILPPGTSFLSGAELIVERDGELRRANAVALFDADGRRSGLAGKRRLVPGGETMAGLERFAWVRDAAFAVAGYVPDLVAFAEPGVLALAPAAARGAAARPWRFTATVCFDNAFDAPYREPFALGPIDFSLVCSNEAWYRSSFELDQMVAFSRLLAIATGRSFVRVTNSGVTVVLDPRGRELARLRDAQGRDREVPGTIAAVVPVPAAGDDAPTTPWVRRGPLWKAGLLLAAALSCFSPRRRNRADATV